MYKVKIKTIKKAPLVFTNLGHKRYGLRYLTKTLFTGDFNDFLPKKRYDKYCSGVKEQKP